jgi:arginine-tRNA-protein transferase
MNKLLLYPTPPHDCGYLPGRQAVTWFVDPDLPKDRTLHTYFSEHGFRRSGTHVYRPQCPGCRACIPVRVPVGEFRMQRRHLRIWRSNQDLTVTEAKPQVRGDYLALYGKYLAERHPRGGMDDPTPAAFADFLTCDWADSVFLEFHLDGTLVCVAVVDRLDDGYSAVYTFFDPAYAGRSLGHYAILYEIVNAQRLGLRCLYLGYWIADCRKMRYKSDYRPLECYWENQWIRFEQLSRFA